MEQVESNDAAGARVLADIARIGVEVVQSRAGSPLDEAVGPLLGHTVSGLIDFCSSSCGARVASVTGTTSKIMQPTDADDSINRPKICEITNCGQGARDTVTHPQRGALEVCPMHARNISQLPRHRFLGEVVR